MGIFSGVGGLLNDITGATSAAQMSNGFATKANAMQFFYNNMLQQQNIKFQKEVMKNAHQWEAQDLMKAGYNPALTTGLGGASTGGANAGASAGGVGAGTASAGGGAGLLEGIGAIVGMKNSTSATKAQVKLAKAEAGLKQAQAIRQVMDNKIFQELGRKEKIEIINSITAGKDASKAMAKYTNERSRGFSKSVSKTKERHGGAFGANGGYTNSKTTSQTW